MTLRDEWDVRDLRNERPERVVKCLNCGRRSFEDDLCECHDPEEDLSSEVP